MPRSEGSVFKKRKHVFHGKTPKVVTAPSQEFTTPERSREARVSSSSASKIDVNHYSDYNSGEVFDVVNVRSLSSELRKFVVCKNCGGEISLKVDSRSGWASAVIIQCDNCEDKISCKNSEKKTYTVEGSEKALEPMNIRLVYAMRAIGKGLAATKQFCGIMNLPPPPSKFYQCQKVIASAAANVAKASMTAAVEEACELNGGSRDLAVSLDGSWQKRGHTSLNGVVSAASMDHGKIVDVQIFSKYCRCPKKDSGTHEKSCVGNFSGTSGSMEVSGAAAIFGRSLESYGVRYTNYLGDGDSKGFLKVVEQKPYGDDIPIKKLECIGHVQKRMGTRLRKLKSSNPKLSDGKRIGGKGRLTDSAILAIQKYYGLAIRRNVSDLGKMQKAVWATFLHIASSDEKPQHKLCDEEWCKFTKASTEGTDYQHAKHFHLPSAVMDAVKPIFRDLAHPSLLEKCLHGKTQNVNESFNNYIWSRIPKNIFVWLETLELGVYEATACFNNGNIARCQILKEIGVDPGYFCLRELKREDMMRVQKAEKDFLEASKEERQKRSRANKRLEEKYEEAEIEAPSYGAGLY